MQKIKGFFYARKSPDDKEDTKTSIDNQVSLGIKRFEENDWELVKIFIDENISGSDRNRPEFVKMMNEIYSSSEVNIIGVKEQDRFCRDPAFFMDTLSNMGIRGKKLYSCMQSKFLSDEDLGDSVKALLDGDYIKQQRKKADVLLSQKKDAGKPTFRPPFGYMANFKFNSRGEKVSLDKSKNVYDWIISEKEAIMVSGVVWDYLNSISYRATLLKYHIPKAKYYRIIKNSCNGLYSGFIYYIRKFKDPDKKIVRTEEILYPSDHPKIISDELYSKVKEKFRA